MVSKPGPKPREFSNEETAKALAVLASEDGNLTNAAKELDITPYMLKRLRDSYPELYEMARQRMVDDLYDKSIIMAERYSDEILRRLEDPEALAAMRTEKLAVVYGIAVDKVNVMTAVRSKFGQAQKQAQDFSKFSDKDIEKAVDAEFEEIKAEEPTDNESLPSSSEDELLIRPSSLPAFGAILHSSSNPE
jgi:hypothetical protein